MKRYQYLTPLPIWTIDPLVGDNNRHVWQFVMDLMDRYMTRSDQKSIDCVSYARYHIGKVDGMYEILQRNYGFVCDLNFQQISDNLFSRYHRSREYKRYVKFKSISEQWENQLESCLVKLSHQLSKISNDDSDGIAEKLRSFVQQESWTIVKDLLIPSYEYEEMDEMFIPEIPRFRNVDLLKTAIKFNQIPGYLTIDNTQFPENCLDRIFQIQRESGVEEDLQGVWDVHTTEDAHHNQRHLCVVTNSEETTRLIKEEIIYQKMAHVA